MTVYTTDLLNDGTVTADDDQYGAKEQACDNNEATYWQSYESPFPHWWQYEFAVGVTHKIIKLRVKPTYAEGNYRFKDFHLDGSNDGVNFDVLYTGQHGQNNLWEDFTFTNTTAYHYYRIVVVNHWSGAQTIAGIFECEMMAEEIPIPDVTTNYLKRYRRSRVCGSITGV
jgi:hypothetical protein